MADGGYNGYLISIGGVPFGKNLIVPSSYKVDYIMQVLNPWTDANGYEHMSAVDLKALKIEFEIKPMLTNQQFQEQVMTPLRNNFTSAKDRKITISAFVPQTDTYETQLCYVPDFQPSIYGLYDGVIHYDSFRMAFIGGVSP